MFFFHCITVTYRLSPIWLHFNVFFLSSACCRAAPGSPDPVFPERNLLSSRKTTGWCSLCKCWINWTPNHLLSVISVWSLFSDVWLRTLYVTWTLCPFAKWHNLQGCCVIWELSVEQHFADRANWQSGQNMEGVITIIVLQSHFAYYWLLPRVGAISISFFLLICAKIAVPRGVRVDQGAVQSWARGYRTMGYLMLGQLCLSALSWLQRKRHLHFLLRERAEADSSHDEASSMQESRVRLVLIPTRTRYFLTPQRFPNGVFLYH